MPIKTLRLALPRDARLSCGWQAPPKKEGGRPYPQRSDTLVVHGVDPHVLQVYANKMGGTVESAPFDDDRWFVRTNATDLIVLLPSDDEALVVSQFMTAYSSSGLVRKCDGEKCLLWRKPPPEKPKNAKPNDPPPVGELSDEERDCICDKEDLPEKERCNPVTRVALIPEFVGEIPSYGVLELTSSGWGSASNLANDLEWLRRGFGRLPAGVPLRVRVEQHKSREHGYVPVLTLKLAVPPEEAFATMAARAKQGMLSTAKTVPLDAVDELPVGTFVTEDDEPVEGELVDETHAAATTNDAAPAGGTSLPGGAAATPAQQADVVVAGFRCTLAPGAPHTPATTEAEMVSGAQTKQLVALCEQIAITTDDFQQTFAVRYGFGFTRTASFGGATKLQAQEHADWLREQATARAAS